MLVQIVKAPLGLMFNPLTANHVSILICFIGILKKFSGMKWV